jgi:RNA polymerase sigma-70 factor (ECF subfamily)
MPDGVQHDMLTVASDEAVMAAVCARDDSAAFSELVRRWRSRVQRTCLRLTGNQHDADDAAQEAFVKAFVARGQFRGESSFATWFWRIAVNVAHDTRRRRRPHAELPADPVGDVEDNAEASAISSERCQQVQQALTQLTEVQRTVVVLRHFEQLKFREIADVLGIPSGTVASRMADALNRLSEILGPE